MITSEQLHRAKLRVKAKKFRSSIPIGLAIKLPDTLIDSLSDNDWPIFKELLNQLGVVQQDEFSPYWERKPHR